MFCACVNYSTERKWVMRDDKAKEGEKFLTTMVP